MISRPADPNARTESPDEVADREALRDVLDWAAREAAAQGRDHAAMLLAAACRSLEPPEGRALGA
jgi:hypothetical protein